MLIEKPMTRENADYAEFKRLYFTAFPREERIPLSALLEKDASSGLFACYDGEVFCGFYAALSFGDITHILFLAVPEALRGCGYGTRLLALIAARYSGQRIIVDIESEDPAAPNNAQRIRRKAFYLRSGYVESGIEYVWRGVPYQILIRGGSISEGEFEAFWDALESRAQNHA